MDYIVIQAGGKGKRLKYLTENKPKALVPVDNLPMIFHLFRKYPDKRFIIITDYKKNTMKEYLSVFANVKYLTVAATGTGTCSGMKQAMELLPEREPFMLVWSDLILPDGFKLPEEYDMKNIKPMKDYVGLSQTFPCRWKYENGEFTEEMSTDYGVAGLFFFTEKAKLENVPDSGEFVRWLKQNSKKYDVCGLSGTREFGIVEEYEKLAAPKCRPFNRITIMDDILCKEPADAQGEQLARRECAWYEKANKLGLEILPEIYQTNPLKMEYIRGKNIYEYTLSFDEKKRVLEKLVNSLEKLHSSESIPADTFSIKEAYFNKTMERISKIQSLIPFGKEKIITVNGRRCRNVFYHKAELESAVDRLLYSCPEFVFIHGDCTFSNMLLRENGEPVLIDPRGYFGFTELYGDVRYDWAKVYYSIAGNYDQFNLKRFRLHIGENEEAGVELKIESNHWEEMADEFLSMTNCDEYEIKLLHAIIWLSLTTYAWQDYDSICGAFYNGIFYLEELL